MRLRAQTIITAASVAYVSLLALVACATPAPPSAAAPAASPGVSPTEPAPAVLRAFAENGGAGCPAPALPPLEQLEPNASLPDPFLSSKGRRITTQAEWTCRRAEIAAQVFWRVSQAQMDAYRATVNPNPKGGQGIQTLASAAGEQPWFRASFGQFGKSTETVQRLPFDQHLVLGLVAPRALFVLDNTDMMWLGDESSFTSSVASAEIWKALGASGAMAASQMGGHPHCTEVPQVQLDELGAFVDKFLLGAQAAPDNVLRSDRIAPDRARWIPWGTPALK
ncbi:MAG: hypothetical protein ABI895_27895 [Deltaproteobacteria bacterium]